MWSRRTNPHMRLEKRRDRNMDIYRKDRKEGRKRVGWKRREGENNNSNDQSNTIIMIMYRKQGRLGDAMRRTEAVRSRQSEAVNILIPSRSISCCFATCSRVSPTEAGVCTFLPSAYCHVS